jgi:uncharacterized RDD family membrane protein YckC
MNELPVPIPEIRPVKILTRYLAWFLDSTLLWLATVPYAFILTRVLELKVSQAEGVETEVLNLGMVFIGLFVQISIHLFQLPVYTYFYYVSGQTPGKRLLGIRIVDFTTLEPLTSAQAVGRYLGSILSSCCCWWGYVLAFLNGDRRALHDYIAGTRVAYSEPVPWTTGEVVLTIAICILAGVGAVLFPVLFLATIVEAMEAMENPLWYVSMTI